MDGAALLEKLPLISRTLISLSVPTGGERLKLHLMNWLVVSGLVHSLSMCARVCVLGLEPDTLQGDGLKRQRLGAPSQEAEPSL